MNLKLATLLCATLLAAGCVSQQTYNTEVAKANTLTTQNQQLDALNQQLRGELASDQAQITQLQNQLKVTMVNEVLFAEGGWTLSPKGEAALAKIAPSLSKPPLSDEYTTMVFSASFSRSSVANTRPMPSSMCSMSAVSFCRSGLACGSRSMTFFNHVSGGWIGPWGAL